MVPITVIALECYNELRGGPFDLPMLEVNCSETLFCYKLVGILQGDYGAIARSCGNDADLLENFELVERRTCEVGNFNFKKNFFQNFLTDGCSGVQAKSGDEYQFCCCRADFCNVGTTLSLGCQLAFFLSSFLTYAILLL